MYIYILTFFHNHLYFLKKSGGGQVLCVFICEVFVLHCFACCPLMSFGKCLVYISLHCSVCCPLMSFWKCLVYIVLCVVLWEVFGLHCLVCCPLGSVWLPGDVPPPKDWWHSLGMYKIRAQPLYSTKPPLNNTVDQRT